MFLFQTSLENENPETIRAGLDAAKKAIMADPELRKEYEAAHSMRLRDPEHRIDRELADLYYRHPAEFSRLVTAINDEAGRLADLDMMAKKGIPMGFTYEQLPFNKDRTAKAAPRLAKPSPKSRVTDATERLQRTLYHRLDIMTDYEKFSKFRKAATKPRLI